MHMEFRHQKCDYYHPLCKIEEVRLTPADRNRHRWIKLICGCIQLLDLGISNLEERFQPL